MKRPNILIFMTDQQRGATVLPDHPARTPHLDRFRSRSVAFKNTFAPSPHCCPSRATFFTGLYPSQHGVWNNVCVQNAHSTGPKAGTRLWSQDLADAGYHLDWNGKWHVSWEEGPDDHGFQIQSIISGPKKHGQGVMGPEWSFYEKLKDPSHRERGQILRPGWGTYTHYGAQDNPFGDGDTVDSAIAAILSRDDEQPWCHYIGTLGPHDPYRVPQEFLDLYDPDDVVLPANFGDLMQDKPGLYRRTRSMFDQLSEEEHREALRHYLAFCTYEDHLFGLVLEALEQSGQADNTVVIYVSDHGDYMAEHGLWCKGLPCFRGAYEVPLIISVPDMPGPGREVDAFISLADLAPTILDLAGIAQERPFTGKSLLPFLENKAPQKWRDAVFTQSNGNELYGIQRSVTTRDWKLVYNGFDFDELYDLQNDPGEVRNLARDPRYSDARRDLYQRLWTFARETDDNIVNNYIMVGLAEFGPGLAFNKRDCGAS